MNFLEQLLFGYGPYIALSVFVVGLLYRFEHDQYQWQAASSQLLRTKKGFGWASNLFHFGMLGLLGGHIGGLLVPASVWHFVGIPDSAHQMLELVMGSIAGAMTFIGLSWLILRRLFDERVRAAGSFADLFIAVLLWLTLVIGMTTLPHSYETRESGQYLHQLSSWCQGVFLFEANNVRHLQGIPWTFKAHILCGLGVLFVFPFTRLVHVCSAPIGYLWRKQMQIVRSRKAGAA
jgi:nitrate reductase gamma subunit